MNLLCKIFGHKPPIYASKGWWSPGEEYAKVNPNIAIDRTGRKHAKVYAECPRCHSNFRLCRIHLPKE